VTKQTEAEVIAMIVTVDADASVIWLTEWH